MNDIHIHLHPGVSPEVATAAVQAARHTTPTPAKAEENGGHTQPDPDQFEEYIRRSYTESWGKAVPLLEFLADNPGRPIPYTEVSEALGFPTNRSLPGLLGSFGKRANHRYHGFWPFEVVKVDGSDGWHMVMSQEAADIINDLR